MDGNGKSRVLIVGETSPSALLTNKYEEAGLDAVQVSPSELTSDHTGFSAVHVVSPHLLEDEGLTGVIAELGVRVALPFAPSFSLSLLESIVVRFEQAGLPLMLAYPPLYAESFHRLQHSIATGFAGEVREIALEMPGSTRELPDKVLTDAPENDTCVGLSYLALLAGDRIDWQQGISQQTGRVAGRVKEAGTAVSVCGTPGSLPRLVVTGDASTLTLSLNDKGHILEASRNNVSRVLARFDDEDLLGRTVKAVQRFVDNRTRRVVSGHSLLFLRQVLEGFGRSARELSAEPQPPEAQAAGTDGTDLDEAPYEVYRKLPPTLNGEAAETLWEAKLNVEKSCNQNCVFCFARDGDVQPADLSDAPHFFGRMTAQGIEGVMFSGREPTLNVQLNQYIRQAKEAGLDNVTVETNALLFADPDFTDSCRAAGLDAAFVSFHSVHSRTVDIMTRVPGSFGRTLAGIRNLLNAGIAVELNCVMTQHNYRELEELPPFVAANLAGVKSLTFSFVAPLARAYLNTSVVPRISEVAPHLSRTLLAAHELGLMAQVPGRCGIPLCFLPGQEDFFVEYRLRRHVTRPGNGGAQDRVKAKGCEECPFDSYCQGLWLTYAQMYGTGEIAEGVERLLAHHANSTQAE